MSKTPYRLVERLETGALADLFLAQRDGDPTELVLKLFHRKTSDPRYAEVLASENALLRASPAEGLVAVEDVGWIEGRLVAVRRHLPGVPLSLVLRGAVAKTLIVAPPVAVDILVRLLEVLDRAHQLGVVHGALTPANVLLTSDGKVHVVDFGALRALQSVPALRRAYSGRGRDAYRAPEVIKGDAPSLESDLFSVGALAYELLTLREPIVDRGGSIGSRRDALPPPSRLDRRLSARLDPLVMRALETQRGRRYRSCADLAEALRKHLTQIGGATSGAELQRLLGEAAQRAPERAGGTLPFEQAFTLEPIDGAERDEAEETQARGVLPRTSFSEESSKDAAAGSEASMERPDEGPEGGSRGRGGDPGDERGESGTVDVARSLGPTPGGPGAGPSPFGEEPTQAATEPGWEAPEAQTSVRVRRAEPLEPPEHVKRIRVFEDLTSVGFPPGGREETDPTGPPRMAREDAPPRSSGMKRAARGAAGREVSEAAGARPPRASGARGAPARLGDLPGEQGVGAKPPRASGQRAGGPPRPPRASGMRGKRGARPPRASGTAPLHRGGAPDGREAILGARLPPKLGGQWSDTLRGMKRRGRAGLLAFAVGALGLVVLVVAGLPGEDPGPGPSPKGELVPEHEAPPTDPSSRAVDDALRAYYQREAEAAARERGESVRWHEPPPREQAAFLSVQTSLPSAVFVDGQRVRTIAPLHLYPLAPGEHRIELEPIGGNTRSEHVLEFEQGRVREIDETSTP